MILYMNNHYHHGDLRNALIHAGLEILDTEGLNALSLRKVAQKAGVSRAAPYAHFRDKQALIAAISTESFRELYITLDTIQANSPGEQLAQTAWAYVHLAQNHPDRFKLMFSSVLEKEKEYPEFVEISQRNFQKLVEITAACQRAGILKSGPQEVMALCLWSAVHGFCMLLLEGQVPRALLGQISPREIVSHLIMQMAVETTPPSPKISVD